MVFVSSSPITKKKGMCYNVGGLVVCNIGMLSHGKKKEFVKLEFASSS
jgi:hypothetical protein